MLIVKKLLLSDKVALHPVPSLDTKAQSTINVKCRQANLYTFRE